MATRRNRGRTLSKKTRTNRKKMSKSQKKWTTAIEAAQQTLNKTGSVTKAHIALRSQALINARKIFGSVGKT